MYVNKRKWTQNESIWSISEDSSATHKETENALTRKKVTITQGSLPITSRLIKRFHELKFPQSLISAFQYCGWPHPYCVQGCALPILCERSDPIIFHSPRQSGKTIAAAIAIFSKISWDFKVIQAMVLCPTCELADSLYMILDTLASRMGNISVQRAIRKDQIKDKAITDHILVATPAKVTELIDKNFIALQHVRLLVLENSESMMAHLGPISFITSKVSRDVQIVALCSAPRSSDVQSFMGKLCRSVPIIMNFQMESTQSSDIKKIFFPYESLQDKLSLIDNVLKRCISSKLQCLVICERRDELEDIHQYLNNNRYEDAEVVYGKLDFSKRKEIIDRFLKYEIPILVTTPAFINNIQTSRLSVVINSDIILTKDKCFDHDAYKKRAELLNGKANAFVLNFIPDRWQDRARDENGAELLFWSKKAFEFELANLKI